MNRAEYQAYIDRLRHDPADAEALNALEAALHTQEDAAVETSRKRRARAGEGARFGVKVFLGVPLHEAIIKGWDAWSAHLAGRYASGTDRLWPEAETRDVLAAFATRFTRVGTFGIIMAMLPIVILGFQTLMVGVQIWQINQQNDLVKEQNSLVLKQNQLNAEQFGESYKTQLMHLLFVEGCKNGRCTDAQIKRNREILQQQAVRGLVSIHHTRKERAPLQGANLERLDLSQADLSRAIFDRAELSGARLVKANLTSASLRSATLDGADLSGAVLDGADLRGAELSGANLTEASLKKAVMDGVVFRSAAKGGAARGLGSLVKADLSEARLYPTAELGQRKTTPGVDFTPFDHLVEVNFTGANLNMANFREVNLTKSKLNDALLQGAFLSQATLTSTSLVGADLRAADLSGATLNGVSLKGARLDRATLGGVKWLNVTCPDGSSSKSHGDTCVGHLEP